ncbi:glycoside hydrolase family 16 protein, partial [Myriangium duriaei CBS 260.36]
MAHNNQPNPSHGGKVIYQMTVDATNTESQAANHHQLNPRSWTGKIKLAVTVGLLILVGAIVGGVIGGKKKGAPSYPDYSYLQYSLSDAYTGEDFFNNFDYVTDKSATNGFVHYVSEATAAAGNLTYASASSAILRVDMTDRNASTGRNSVRIISKKTYDTGLFIFDVAHSPYGCATWPALWLLDPSDWPANGEIDVIESVNQGTDGNHMTLHTTANCQMYGSRKQTGSQLTTDCLNSTDGNAGCGVLGSADTYGPVFNANGGGIYAMELRSAGIRVWFFARSAIPSDLSELATKASSLTPDPTQWGEALADFPSTHCDIGTHFRNQSIVANIDLCGDWAGQSAVYSSEDKCPGLTCESYAAVNASAFEEAYWQWNGWWVFGA